MTVQSYQAQPSPPSYESRPASAGEYKYKPIHYPTEIKIAQPSLVPHSVEESSVSGHKGQSVNYGTSSYKEPTYSLSDKYYQGAYEKLNSSPTPTSYSKPVQSSTIPKLNIAEYFPEVETAQSHSLPAATNYGHQSSYEAPSKATGYSENKKSYEGSSDSYKPQQEYVKPVTSYKPSVAIPYDPLPEKETSVNVYNVPSSNNAQKVASLNQDEYAYPSAGYVENEPSYPSVASYSPEKSYGKPSISNEEYSVTSHTATPYYQTGTEKESVPSYLYDGKQSYENIPSDGEVGNVALYYKVNPQPSYSKENKQQNYYASTENVYTKPEVATQSYDNTGYPHQASDVAVFYQVKNIPSSSSEGHQNNYGVAKSEEKSSSNYGATQVQAGETASYGAVGYQHASDDYSQSSQPASYPQSQYKGTAYDDKSIDSGNEYNYNPAKKVVSSQPAYYPATVESKPNPPSYSSGVGKVSKGNSNIGSEYSKTKTVAETSNYGSSSKYSSPSAASNGYTTKQGTPISTNSDGSLYGEKIVTVKVPSVNKAALLSKWGPTTTYSSTSDSLVDYSNAYDAAEGEAPSVSYSDASLYSTSTQQDNTSKNVQRIKAKKPASTSYDSTSSVSREYDSVVSSSYPQLSQGKLYSNVNSTEVKKSKYSNADSGYGQRYLERINKDKARNETLSPEVCVRAGLFRHPSDCQKFYEVSI